jgi:DNA repair exonuclease SbcCD ATPase subunit
MPRRTTKILDHLRFRSLQHQDAHKGQPQGGDAHKGALRAFQNATHQPPHSNVPRSPGEAQGAGSDAHVSSQKSRPARDGSHPPLQSKPLPPKPENEGVQANTRYQNGMGSNENGSPIENNPSELDSEATVLPRVTDVSKISETWASTVLQTIEDDGSDSIAVMGKMYDHLRKVMFEFPSIHPEGDTPSCSPAGIERALLGLIQAYESVHRSAHEYEKALKTKNADYESLRKQFNHDWAQKHKDFEDEIATLKKENEKALKTKDADYESLEKQFNHDWAQKQRNFENKIATLKKENEKALKTKDADYELLGKRFNRDWAQKHKDFEDKIATLEKENEKEVDRLKTVISVLKEEHASWEQRYDDKMKKLQEDYQSEKTAVADGYKLQIQELDNKMRLLDSNYEGELKRLKKQHREQEAILQRANEEAMAEMQRDFNIQMLQSQESLRTTREHYETRLKEMGTQHDKEKRQMTSRFDTEKAQANNYFLTEKAALSATIKSQGESYEAQLMNLRKQNRDDKQNMETKYQNEKAAMEKSKQAVERQYYTQLGIAKENYDKEMERRDEEIEKLEDEHECEMEKMRERHDAEKLELEAKWEEKIKILMDEKEDLKSALVKRDHFKAMSDHELAQRFQNLASEVDEFARVRWDSRLESTWPFPDQLLRNSENERRTKQHVVQNTLWVILYEKIFCTPFRVLGEGGKPLELEWIKKYGQGRLLCSISPGPMN